MSISITVNADSTLELADKLLAIGTALSGQIGTSPPTADPAPETKAAKPARGKPAKAEEPKAEEPKAEEPKAEEPKVADDATRQEIDFDRDVQPLVLKAAAAAGRAKVMDLFSQFGVTKASDVEDSRLPELTAGLKDLIG